MKRVRGVHCTPKNEGKRVHVPPDEKTCGHAVGTVLVMIPLAHLYMTANFPGLVAIPLTHLYMTVNFPHTSIISDRVKVVL